LLRYLDKSSFLLEPDSVLSPSNVHSSEVLDGLVFCHQSKAVYTHTCHTLHCMMETREHRRLRLHHTRRAELIASPRHHPVSPLKVCSYCAYSSELVCYLAIVPITIDNVLSVLLSVSYDFTCQIVFFNPV